MLSMCDIQDKGKGPYTEINKLLSEYPSSGKYKIKFMNCVAGLDSHEWKCSLINFDYLLYTCGTSGFTERADLLRLSK